MCLAHVKPQLTQVSPNSLDPGVFLAMSVPETWYVQVDCYFFTEDLRQFSFGRIGVLKEV